MLPPLGSIEEAPPLVGSMSAPDLPLQLPIRKEPCGEAAIIEEEDDAEGEGDGEDARCPELKEEAQLQPLPPPPSTQPPPPTHSPPPLLLKTEHKPAQGSFLNEYFFGSHDGIPIPPSTLESSPAEPSWVAERREPPPPEPDGQPPPSAAAEDVAEGKKPAVEARARRPLTQKATRKAEGKKGRAVMLVTPRPARLGDILHTLDDHFVKASESAHEVSKLFQAARMHYHSNFTETRDWLLIKKLGSRRVMDFASTRMRRLL